MWTHVINSFNFCMERINAAEASNRNLLTYVAYRRQPLSEGRSPYSLQYEEARRITWCTSTAHCHVFELISSYSYHELIALALLLQKVIL